MRGPLRRADDRPPRCRPPATVHDRQLPSLPFRLFPCPCVWHMQLASAECGWHMQSAVAGLSARVPTAHAVISVNEKRHPGHRKDISRPRGPSGSKGQSHDSALRRQDAAIGYAEPSEWLGSWRVRYGRGLRVLPVVATRTNMTGGLAGNRRPLPANGLPRRAEVHMRRSERGAWRCEPGGGDSSLPLDRTYRSSHEPVLRCLVVRGDEHHLLFRQPHRGP